VIDFIASFVKGRDDVPAAEVEAWAEELHQLGQKGIISSA
jgi:hypothetical protein